MDHLTEKKLSSEEIFKGKIINLRIDTVQLPNGKEGKREIVEHPGAVAVVAINEKEEIVIVHQYRAPVEKVIIEIPAGKLEKNEDPLECAKRELEEETGYKAGHWEKLYSFYTSPGFANEELHLYMAKNLTKVQQSLDEDEFVEIDYLPITEALKLAREEKIKDAKTLLGIQAAALFLKA